MLVQRVYYSELHKIIIQGCAYIVIVYICTKSVGPATRLQGDAPLLR